MTTLNHVHPSLTNKIFEGFACREVGPGTAVLLVDYSMMCRENGDLTLEWIFLFQLCMGLVVAWPIGLPFFLWFKMYRARKLIAEGDHDTLALFDFVLGDYGPEHWYWEVVRLRHPGFL